MYKGCIFVGDQVEKKIMDIFSQIDKNKLNQTKNNLEKFMNTEEGKRMLEQIKNIDKNKLRNVFMGIDTEEAKNKLINADLSKLSKMKSDSFLDNLK